MPLLSEPDIKNFVELIEQVYSGTQTSWNVHELAEFDHPLIANDSETVVAYSFSLIPRSWLDC